MRNEKKKMNEVVKMKMIEGEARHRRDNDEVVPPGIAKNDKTYLNNLDISECFTTFEVEKDKEGVYEG